METLLIGASRQSKSIKKLEESKKRILTFLCACKLDQILKCLPADLQKLIISFLPEDIFSVQMLTYLMSASRYENIASYIKNCPNKWVREVIQNEKKEIVWTALQEHMLNCANQLCCIKNDNDKTANQCTKDPDVKKLLDPIFDDERNNLIRNNLEELKKQIMT